MRGNRTGLNGQRLVRELSRLTIVPGQMAEGKTTKSKVCVWREPSAFTRAVSDSDANI